ncbi:MAG TPA: hypothetical protein VIB59_01415 [Solirubrobacteraceae bacterium]|jgi:hypothetical protein
MARSAKKKVESGRTQRLKAIPWATLLQGGVVVGSRWRRLSAKERERLRALVRRSRGRVDNLSVKERKELRKLAGKLDLKGMGKELLALRAVRRRGLRRR